MFTREIDFYPAWSRRSEDPNKDFGIHGLEMAFILIGDKATVIYKLMTNWYDRETFRKLEGQGNYDIGTCSRPHSAGIGVHVKVEHDDPSATHGSCQWTRGTCRFVSYTDTEDNILEVLITKGQEDMWLRLEKFYKLAVESK